MLGDPLVAHTSPPTPCTQKNGVPDPPEAMGTSAVAAAVAPLLRRVVDSCRHIAECRVTEKHVGRKRHTRFAMDAIEHPHRKKRVSTQQEEVVMDADLRHVQQFVPNVASHSSVVVRGAANADTSVR